MGYLQNDSQRHADKFGPNGSNANRGGHTTGRVNMADKQIGFRPTDGLRERLERTAEAESRSVSNMINLILDEGLTAREKAQEESQKESQ